MAHLAQPVRLASDLDQPIQALRLDVHQLLETTHTSGAKACRLLAQTLGQMLDTDLGRLVGRQAAAAPADSAGNAYRSTPRSTGVAALAAFDKPRAVGARLIDYSTANAWWGIPGCLLPVGAGIAGQPAGCGQRASAADAAADGRTDPTAMLSDAWLQHDLGPQLLTALRQPVSRRELNHRSVPSGPTLGITLDPRAQFVAQRIADCFTGHLAAADCADATPADPRWRAQHLQAPGALRAGAVGLVLVDVDSGRILALAGAVSDCTWQNLGHHAQPEASGRILAVRAGQRCAQLPDQRSAYLATQEPALWLVPPGSSLKPLAVAAGIDGGQVAAGADEHWKGILALSEAQSPVQRLALAAGQHYLDVLHGAGFGHSPQDLVWGDAASPGSAAHLKTRWPHLGHDGEKGLRPARLPFEQIERIRAEKEAGINVDQRYGHAVVTDYLAARALADAVIGGGNLRVSALGLAAWWRQVDLRARGRGEAPALHLLEQPGRPVAMASTQWLSTDAARRVLAITSGVSASAWHGTAQGSCRLVFGACPAQGLPTLSGKTGTSDFLASEGRPEVKSGLQVPAKLFAGVFTGRDGRRYAVAAMALRVREGAGQALELHPSPPAEAALVLARSLGLAQP